MHLGRDDRGVECLESLARQGKYPSSLLLPHSQALWMCHLFLGGVSCQGKNPNFAVSQTPLLNSWVSRGKSLKSQLPLRHARTFISLSSEANDQARGEHCVNAASLCIRPENTLSASGVPPDPQARVSQVPIKSSFSEPSSRNYSERIRHVV